MCIFYRYMAMHGQVWDPKKDGDGLGKYIYIVM